MKFILKGNIMSKYLKFAFTRELPKTKVYLVIAKRSDDCLGTIKWFSRWRQYSFHPIGDSIFNPQCLKDICEFIEKLNREHKGKGKK